MGGWKFALGVTVGLFAAGVAVGYVANKRGIPQPDVPRWLVKGITRRALHGLDALRELMPDAEPVSLVDALEEES